MPGKPKNKLHPTTNLPLDCVSRTISSSKSNTPKDAQRLLAEAKVHVERMIDGMVRNGD